MSIVKGPLKFNKTNIKKLEEFLLRCTNDSDFPFYKELRDNADQGFRYIKDTEIISALKDELSAGPRNCYLEHLSFKFGVKLTWNEFQKPQYIRVDWTNKPKSFIYNLGETLYNLYYPVYIKDLIIKELDNPHSSICDQIHKANLCEDNVVAINYVTGATSEHLISLPEYGFSSILVSKGGFTFMW